MLIMILVFMILSLYEHPKLSFILVTLSSRFTKIGKKR
jgi:hypothetical protein